MPDEPKFTEKYMWAKCCQPQPGDAITGYFSLDDFVKVHRSDCANLRKTDTDRLIPLKWDDILVDREFVPDADCASLDDLDLAILAHHEAMGIDYSLKVAQVLQMDRQDAFRRHRKLRELQLLERVEPTMVRYRKGIVDHKWIKHRNHTYYAITPKGVAIIEYRRRHP